MRISSTQYQRTVNESLQLNQSRTDALTQQMASGARIELPSDDPIGAVRLSRLRREEAIVTQYRDNIATVQTRMLKDETYLSSMVSDIGQGRDLLVWASDGSNNSADLAAMVNSMTALRDSLFYTANVKDQEGHYTFSGTATDQPAIAYDASAPTGARYSFNGNTDRQTVVVGNGITQAVNVDASGLQALLNKMDLAIETLGTPGANPNDPAVSAVLKDGLDGLEDGFNLISGKIAMSGGAQTILGTLDHNHANVSLSNKKALTDIGSLDYALAATDLNGYTTALQSTYKAYAKIGNLSLFDIL